MIDLSVSARIVMLVHLYQKQCSLGLISALSPTVGCEDCTARCCRCCISAVYCWSRCHRDTKGGEGNAGWRHGWNGRHGWHGRNGILNWSTLTLVKGLWAGDMICPSLSTWKETCRNWVLVVWSWSKRNGPYSLPSFHRYVQSNLSTHGWRRHPTAFKTSSW